MGSDDEEGDSDREGGDDGDEEAFVVAVAG